MFSLYLSNQISLSGCFVFKTKWTISSNTSYEYRYGSFFKSLGIKLQICCIFWLRKYFGWEESQVKSFRLKKLFIKIVWYGINRYGSVWYGMCIMVLYCMICYDLLWYSFVWYGLVWNDMVWYELDWYGSVWNGGVLLCLSLELTLKSCFDTPTGWEWGWVGCGGCFKRIYTA